MKLFSFGSAEKLCQAPIFGHTKEDPLIVQVAEFTKLYGDCIHVQSQIPEFGSLWIKNSIVTSSSFLHFPINYYI